MKNEKKMLLIIKWNSKKIEHFQYFNQEEIFFIFKFTSLLGYKKNIYPQPQASKNFINSIRKYIFLFCYKFFKIKLKMEKILFFHKKNQILKELNVFSIFIMRKYLLYSNLLGYLLSLLGKTGVQTIFC